MIRTKVFTIIFSLLACLAVAVSFTFAQTAEQLARAKVLFDEGLANYERRQYDAAIANYTEYLKIRPSEPAAWFNRGLARYYKTLASPNEVGYRQAAADVSQAIKLDSKQAVYWHTRGGIYSQLMAVDFVASRDRAIADFTEAIRLDPKHAAAFRERGVVYERVNRMREALADLNTAIRLDPTNAVAHYTRAKVYGAQKNYPAARRDAETALRLDRNYSVAQIYLDYINSEEQKASAVARNPQLSRPAPIRPETAPPTRSSSSNPKLPAEITDSAEAFQLASAAESARDHRQTIAYSTRVLELLPMAGPTEPRNDLMLSIFTGTLGMRAKAYSALGDNARSDADYERAAKATMDATVRYMKASNNALEQSGASSAAALIRSVGESAKAVIYCTSGYETAKEWVETVDRTRPNVRSDSLKAVVTMAGVRELCVQAHIMHAGGTAVQSALGGNDRQKIYSESLAILQKAIAMMANYAEIYRERAKIHRRFGRADLAAADEKKVRELEAAKSRPN